MADTNAASASAATLSPPVDSGGGVVNTSTYVVDQSTIDEFESLNKWKNLCDDSSTKKIPPRLVYEYNLKKAASKGFPSVLEVGRSSNYGLTDHEIVALYGWTTGDYRFINPIARGLATAEFTDYPLLPQDMSKLSFELSENDVSPYITILRKALSKLPASGQRVWRGHKRPLPREIGNKFVLEGFTSATLDRDNALEFCIKTDGESGNNNASSHHLKRTLLCILQSKSGKSISRFSCRPEEMEVIFLPDTTFEVVPAPITTDDGLEEDHQKAVQQAMESLQKQVPEATIELLYVKEVTA